ncbi:uncharacterized protein HMPREF1541_08326 [Cyphellophora europaea CBS 101466]|uniref:Uncharacterized protein n=1 Tax=Cyphellophora europaea (strain CBS 101466) TaxID=1220924 RepID=W2RM02_CYPE1|nr:uncharacterized protein HMPREF1541_08326 [Cyphellophora europaea CBS 101466]ETN37335.1 hypothetical protein HMPREF1541_08326 [Cyphellophora europaea CBS 101466]
MALPSSSAEAGIDPRLKYARRSRNKTRDDRYEYKGGADSQGATRKSRSANKKRRSHRKSGPTLDQEFRAPNVESKRLTLKQDALPGIFNKGKASEPTVGRGIPDLTFSEMTFLTKKRELDDARIRGIRAMVHPQSNIKGGAQEISGYFATLGSGAKRRSQTNTPAMHSSIRKPQRVFQKPSHRTTGRPVSNIPLGQAISQTMSHLHDSEPTQRPIQLAATACNEASNLPCFPSPNTLRSATCISDASWSLSPPQNPLGGLHKEGASPHRPPYATFGPSTWQSSRVVKPVHPRSSISNLTPSGYIPQPELQAQQANERLGTLQNGYSLEDLKQLAAIREAGYAAQELAANDSAVAWAVNDSAINSPPRSAELQHIQPTDRDGDAEGGPLQLSHSGGGAWTSNGPWKRKVFPVLASLDPNLVPPSYQHETELPVEAEVLKRPGNFDDHCTRRTMSQLETQHLTGERALDPFDTALLTSLQTDYEHSHLAHTEVSSVHAISNARWAAEAGTQPDNQVNFTAPPCCESIPKPAICTRDIFKGGAEDNLARTERIVLLRPSMQQTEHLARFEGLMRPNILY